MVRYLASSLVADNPLQKIGQAVSGENYPPISNALSGGNVIDRQHGGCLNIAAILVVVREATS